MTVFTRIFNRFKRLPIWLQIGSLTLLAICGIIASFIGFVAYEFSPRQMCGSHGSHELRSPDGRYKAVLFEYDCGATTAFGTHIAIIRSDRRFDPYEDSGVIFTSDSNHQAIGVDQNGILPIEILWIDNSHLQVDVPDKVRIFLKKEKMGAVSVVYRSK